MVSPGFFLLASEKLSSSVAVIVGRNGMGAIGVNVLGLASLVNGLATEKWGVDLVACGGSERFAFLLAETAMVISAAARANEISTRASGLRGVSRETVRLILFPRKIRILMRG